MKNINDNVYLNVFEVFHRAVDKIKIYILFLFIFLKNLPLMS